MWAASFLFGGEHMAIMKACPRCRALIPQGLPYCAKCAPLVEAQREEYRAHNQAKRDAQYNRRRDPKYLTFYRSKEWKATSRAKLSSVAYKCEAGLTGCTGLAVEVHHKKPIQTSEGWVERLEWENLEAVCTNCHNGRHERGKRKTPDGVLDMRDVLRGLT